LLTAIAARTSQIRLGTYVVLLGLHNPLRMAEDIATVDLVSNGQFDCAIGGGGQQAECALSGIPTAETFGRTYVGAISPDRYHGGVGVRRRARPTASRSSAVSWPKAV
jgi:hypothetical protein